MADDKVKTKATILHELESIKGLLLEEDDIPILQEVIGQKSLQPASNSPLGQSDLDTLHDAFQAISHTIENRIESHRAQTGSHTSTETLLDKFGQTPPRRTSPVADTKEQQALLFEDEEIFTDSEFDTEQYQENKTPEESSSQINAAVHRREPEEIAAPTSERQEPTTNPTARSTLTDHGTGAKTESASPQGRQTPPKASGENPFLPQHIRARLHGNNPPPLFDPSGNSPISTLVTSQLSNDTRTLSSRQKLTRDVIAAVMPQIEQELRSRLQGLTESELQKMLKQE